jgi:hypothetical protein
MKLFIAFLQISEITQIILYAFNLSIKYTSYLVEYTSGLVLPKSKYVQCFKNRSACKRVNYIYVTKPYYFRLKHFPTRHVSSNINIYVFMRIPSRTELQSDRTSIPLHSLANGVH